ncbi:hypothetical protein O3P69_020853 [Scylla paramamosain]|uniref:PARP-type domain-containing protein n=1 Tax=Scylla paramamosain TaxID=85552 RepID=A0AAW0TN48_SCYPA
MFDNILKSILLASYSTSPRAAKHCRMRKNRQAHRGGRVAFNYEHEWNHVPVLCKKSSSTMMDYPYVSKLPALNTDALRGVPKSIEDFISHFPGVSANRYGQYFNFAHKAMFYPGPVLLESSIACADFKKLARNIFINTKTKITLVEYDFIGLCLKELLEDSCYGIMDIKINCIKDLDRDRNDDEENVFRYREDLINRMPFLVVEIGNLAQRLINNGLAITKATANYFAMDIKDNTRHVLAILDCLSPLGYDFKMAERQVKRTQRDAPAQNRVWSEEIEEEKTGEVTRSENAAAAAVEESIDNYYPFLQDRNETFFRVPAYIIPSCAPEITNLPIFNGGSSTDIVSEATEASTAYVISKVLEETLCKARNASSYDKASCNPRKLRLVEELELLYSSDAKVEFNGTPLARTQLNWCRQLLNRSERSVEFSSAFPARAQLNWHHRYRSAKQHADNSFINSRKTMSQKYFFIEKSSSPSTDMNQKKSLAKCKVCKSTLERGQLTIARLVPKAYKKDDANANKTNLWYHVDCSFERFRLDELRSCEEVINFIRLVIGKLRIKAGAKHVLNGVGVCAYDAFCARRDISEVVSAGRQLSSSATTAPCVFMPVMPMLGQCSTDLFLDRALLERVMIKQKNRVVLSELIKIENGKGRQRAVRTRQAALAKGQEGLFERRSHGGHGRLGGARGLVRQGTGKWKTVTKAHAGLDNATLERLEDEMKAIMVKSGKEGRSFKLRRFSVTCYNKHMYPTTKKKKKKREGSPKERTQDFLMMRCFCKTHTDAIVPKVGTGLSAGSDLHALLSCTIPAGDQVEVRTGVVLDFVLKDNEKAAKSPPLSWGFYAIENSVHTTTVLAGVIDTDYREEVKVMLRNDSKDQTFEIKLGVPVAMDVLYDVACPVTRLIDATGAIENLISIDDGMNEIDERNPRFIKSKSCYRDLSHACSKRLQDG